MKYPKYAEIKGRLCIIGFGSIGQGVLPLILRHLDISPSKITIISAGEEGREIAQEFGVEFIVRPLTKANYIEVLKKAVGKNDFLLNLSVNVSSTSLIQYCRDAGALYLDTCIEPWEGGYTDPDLTVSERSNYRLREEAIKLKTPGKSPTALIAHGANPGLVSHFVKEALLRISVDVFGDVKKPEGRKEWASLASRLGIKTIHIAERDTQESAVSKARGEFVNTWSVDGFISEGMQPAELGWGTHEKKLPEEGHRHGYGCGAAIYLEKPGGSVRVRSWTPQEGAYHGFLIAHNEAISLADYFSLKTGAGETSYRPTVHYAYHPCNDAVLSLHECAGRQWSFPESKRLMMKEITSGVDELGVLIMGHEKGAYWYGSSLSIEQAKSLVPYNNATSLQVASAVLAGMVWAIENPDRGVVEAEEADFERILEIASPYLGDLDGFYSDWTPLKGRGALFREKIDQSDPWQFQNFIVH